MKTEYAGTLRMTSEVSEFALSVRAMDTTHDNARFSTVVTIDHPELIPEGLYDIAFSGEIAISMPLSPSLVIINRHYRLVGLRQWQTTDSHWYPVYRNFGDR